MFLKRPKNDANRAANKTSVIADMLSQHLKF